MSFPVGLPTVGFAIAAAVAAAGIAFESSAAVARISAAAAAASSSTCPSVVAKFANVGLPSSAAELSYVRAPSSSNPFLLSWEYSLAYHFSSRYSIASEVFLLLLCGVISLPSESALLCWV